MWTRNNDDNRLEVAREATRILSQPVAPADTPQESTVDFQYFLPSDFVPVKLNSSITTLYVGMNDNGRIVVAKYDNSTYRFKVAEVKFAEEASSDSGSSDSGSSDSGSSDTDERSFF